MKKGHMTYAVSIHLVRDPGVTDDELVESLTQWKELQDAGPDAPEWNTGGTPATLDGFLRLLVRSGDSDRMSAAGIVRRGDVINCVNTFEGPGGWIDLIAKALSWVAYGLKARTYLNTSCVHGTAGVVFRRFEVFLNGDGEPEFEEVEQ